MKENKNIGISYLIDLFGIEEILLNDPKVLESKLRVISKEFKATILKWEHHNFTPKGFTGFLLLKESHLSIHTWPEKDYIAIDFFTCGYMPAKEKVEQLILELFSPKKLNIEIKQRGNL